MMVTGIPAVIKNVQEELRPRAIFMEVATKPPVRVPVNQDGAGMWTALRALRDGLDLTVQLSSPTLLISLRPALVSEILSLSMVLGTNTKEMGNIFYSLWNTLRYRLTLFLVTNHFVVLTLLLW